MPYPLPSEATAAFAAGRMVPAVLVDFYTDPIKRFWNWPDPLTYGGDAYVSLWNRITVDYAVRQSATLAAEPVTITLDASRIGDNDDPVGGFVDLDWHQRRVRVRVVLLDFDTMESPSDPVWEWRGRMDHRQLNRAPGTEQTLVLTCEGGLFRIRGRRMHTRTDRDQRTRSAADRFFDLTPIMAVRTPIWGKASANIPGVRVISSPGGGGGGGFDVLDASNIGDRNAD
jgi:hypothetical protein